METVEDIVREMRARKLCMPRAKIEIDGDTYYAIVSLQDLADRIEAAHGREDADLRRRLKVAEDALAEVLNCDTDGIVLNFEETQIVNGHDLAIEAVNAVDKARNAIAAIREEGANNGK